MTVEAYLMQQGASPLRANVVGDIIADWVEVATGNPVLPAETSQSVLDKLNALTDQELANRILYKDVHEELLRWQSWDQIQSALNNSPESKARSRAIYLLVILISLLTFFFGGIIGYEYITTKVQPSIEQLLVVFGPLGLAISLLFGVSTETAISTATSLAARRRV